MRVFRGLLAGALSLCLACGLAGCGEGEEKPDGERREMHNHSVYPEGVAFADALWQPPEFFYDAGRDRPEGNVRAVWIRSDYLGEESYAFAYLGIPDGASAQARAPGVLLVPGGGGTAYWEWAKKWSDRGYVALAVDLEGHVPLEGGRMTDAPADLYEKSEYDAPFNRNYGDAAKPLEETWMHYAARTAILGNSFLHSLDCTDPYQIGVCGVSWGGVITSIITGYDDRFAFSVPIYCSLNIAGTPSTLGGYYEKNPAALIWDDDTPLSKVSTPIHFVTSNIEPNALVSSTVLTRQHCKNAVITVLKDWQHSQAIAAEAMEPVNFADSVVKGGSMVSVKVQPDSAGRKMVLEIPKGSTLAAAVLVYTEEPIAPGTSWGRKKASVEGNTVTYTIPDGCSAFYLSVEDVAFNTVSSDLVYLNQ